jgi:hypothetical protein
MAITIRVPWQDPHNHGDAWNELLAWTIETFGMPGERMQFHPDAMYMDFVFDDEHDALMFQLKTAGHRRTEQDVTVEYLSQWL